MLLVLRPGIRGLRSALLGFDGFGCANELLIFVGGLSFSRVLWPIIALDVEGRVGDAEVNVKIGEATGFPRSFSPMLGRSRISGPQYCNQRMLRSAKSHQTATKQTNSATHKAAIDNYKGTYFRKGFFESLLAHIPCMTPLSECAFMTVCRCDRACGHFIG